MANRPEAAALVGAATAANGSAYGDARCAEMGFAGRWRRVPGGRRVDVAGSPRIWIAIQNGFF
jgi:hypothetical protein